MDGVIADTASNLEIGKSKLPSLLLITSARYLNAIYFEKGRWTPTGDGAALNQVSKGLPDSSCNYALSSDLERL